MTLISDPFPLTQSVDADRTKSGDPRRRIPKLLDRRKIGLWRFVHENQSKVLLANGLPGAIRSSASRLAAVTCPEEHETRDYRLPIKHGPSGDVSTTSTRNTW